MTSTLYPITVAPLLKERVWGGRRLEELYGKPLPAGVPIGESWEITDRPEGVSMIRNGPLAGKDLRWLMEHHHEEVLGAAGSAGGRFPLLVKILDAQEKLSLQVHPPADLAASLSGEPKTELWYVAAAAPGAELYVGLKKGTIRSEFERKIADGAVADCFHRVPVKRGDVMFLPSGRVHALGAGLVIFEIQQNSDTTYRVDDWNRMGLDGKPRELHVEQSLRCIDFNDFEPGLVANPTLAHGDWTTRVLADNPLFRVIQWRMDKASQGLPVRKPGVMQILAVVAGKMRIEHPVANVNLDSGGFCLLPAALENATLEAAPETEFLLIEAAC